MTLAELAEHIGAELRSKSGDAGSIAVTRCARIDEAGDGDVTFIANQKYADQLSTTGASAVIVAADVESNGRTLLVADDPYYAFRNAVVALHGWREHPRFDEADVSDLAVVSPEAEIGEGTIVHPFAVVSARAKIGANCVVYPHVFIGPDVTIGDGCQLFPQVTVYDHSVIGNRVTLHAGTSIGQDGFGYATHQGAHHKIPQAGNVVIEDDVEMGSNCSIDRATLGATRIRKGTKFSDGVTIGHGADVGEHNLYVAMVGLAGSVTTGKYVVIGGQTGVAGHLKIGDMAQLAASSGVMTDVPDGGRYGGLPAGPLKETFRVHAHAQKLPDLAARVKKLERELAKLRKESDAD